MNVPFHFISQEIQEIASARQFSPFTNVGLLIYCWRYICTLFCCPCFHDCTFVFGSFERGRIMWNLRVHSSHVSVHGMIHQQSEWAAWPTVDWNHLLIELLISCTSISQKLPYLHVRGNWIIVIINSCSNEFLSDLNYSSESSNKAITCRKGSGSVTSCVCLLSVRPKTSKSTW